MHEIHKLVGTYIMEQCDVICVTVLLLNHDLFSYLQIGNVNTQTTVDEPGPQLVVEHPPQGMFTLSVMVNTSHNIF